MPLVRLKQETPGRKAGAEHLHSVGEVVNVSDGLAQYWVQEGRAELVVKNEFDPDYGLEVFTVVQLREMAKKQGIPYSGLNKAALIAALEQ
jgi:hypothetical protein